MGQKAFVFIFLALSLAVWDFSSAEIKNSEFDSNFAPTFDQKITFDLIHTNPSCKQPGKSSTYCTNSDLPRAQSQSRLISRISGILDQYALDKIEASSPRIKKPGVFVAFLSFSDKRIQEKICAVGAAGIPVEIVLDHGSKEQIESILNDSCQADPRKPNLKLHYLGGLTKKAWRLHHNKFIAIDPGDGTSWSLNFSSGNLSTFGMTLHFDHWVFLTAPPKSNLVRTHQCVIKALRVSIDEAQRLGMYEDGVNPQHDKAIADSYIVALDNCYRANHLISMLSTEDALSEEGIAPLFSPNKNNEISRVLIAEIEKVTHLAHSISSNTNSQAPYIYIAIQHFMHEPTARALREAAEAGVDVRIIMDDDVVTGQTGIPGATRFLWQNLMNSKIKIRFIQTNADVRQMMHNKFAILNGKRSFSGAGHYTNSAFQKNWENFYLIENHKLVSQYREYFDSLWKMSIDSSIARK